MKKIIVLVLSILIPLLAAFGIGLYGTKKRYDPQVNTAVLSEFIQEMNEGIIDSEGRIDNYRKTENYYFEKEPIFKKDIMDGEKRVLTVAIYRNLCLYQPSSNVEETYKSLFEVFVYNVNYDIVKSYFHLDDMSIIENAAMPSFTIEFLPTNGKEGFSIELKNRSNVVIPDYESIPEYASGENKTRNYVQSNIFREYEESVKNLSNFTSEAKINLKATITVTNDDKTTNTILAEKDVFNETITDFKYKSSEINKEDLEVGFRESSVIDTYRNAGYYKWLFKNYIWWQGLIAIGLAGIVTGTFALVYFAEEENKKQKFAKMKK